MEAWAKHCQSNAEVADLMFEKTLEKRKQTAKKAEELF